MKIFFLQQFIFSAVFLLEAHGTYFFVSKVKYQERLPKSPCFSFEDKGSNYFLCNVSSLA